MKSKYPIILSFPENSVLFLESNVNLLLHLRFRYFRMVYSICYQKWVLYCMEWFGSVLSSFAFSGGLTHIEERLFIVCF